MRDLAIIRSEAELQTKFSERLWRLYDNIPVLYEALLQGFRDEGVTAADIRSDAGDGSLGAYSVTFWLLNTRASVKIRLESATLGYANLSAVDHEGMARTVTALLSTVRIAAPNLQFLGHTATYSCHGRVEGVDAPAFLARFAERAPVTNETGRLVANSAAFFYGEAAPSIVSSSLTIERSLIHDGALFFRAAAIIAGHVDDAREIVETAERHVRRLFAAADLRLP